MKNIVGLVVITTFFFILYGGFKTSKGLPDNIQSKYGDGVVLYATDWCGYCAKMREFLAQKNIQYIEHNIEKSAEGRQEYDQLNANGIPIVVVKGRVVSGYNPDAVLSIYSGVE